MLFELKLITGDVSKLQEAIDSLPKSLWDADGEGPTVSAAAVQPAVAPVPEPAAVVQEDPEPEPVVEEVTEAEARAAFQEKYAEIEGADGKDKAVDKLSLYLHGFGAKKIGDVDKAHYQEFLRGLTNV